MGALTRVLQEDFKKSAELTFTILKIFLSFSNFIEMHALMANYRSIAPALHPTPFFLLHFFLSLFLPSFLSFCTTLLFSSLFLLIPCIFIYRIGLLTMKSIEYEIKRAELREAENSAKDVDYEAGPLSFYLLIALFSIHPSIHPSLYNHFFSSLFFLF